MPDQKLTSPALAAVFLFAFAQTGAISDERAVSLLAQVIAALIWRLAVLLAESSDGRPRSGPPGAPAGVVALRATGTPARTRWAHGTTHLVAPTR
jgi:hypothetical protein